MAEQSGDHHEVLPTGHRRLDRSVLAREADGSAYLVGTATCVDAGHHQAPCVRAQQCGHGPHEGRFACAVRTEHGGDLARSGHEVQPGEGLDTGLSAAEALGEALGLDDIVGVSGHGCSVRQRSGHLLTAFPGMIEPCVQTGWSPPSFFFSREAG